MSGRAIATGLLTLVVIAIVGCGSMSSGRRQSAAELSDPDPNGGNPAAAASTTSPAQSPAGPGSKSFVQRHPLFARPADYYRNAGDNPWSKTAAAVVVGVPVGVAEEMWQIVRGK